MKPKAYSAAVTAKKLDISVSEVYRWLHYYDDKIGMTLLEEYEDSEIVGGSTLITADSIERFPKRRDELRRSVRRL